jgi:hypothetical protein
MRSLVLLLVLLLLPVNGDKLLRRRDYDADRASEAMTKPDQEHRSLGKGGKGNSGGVIEGCVGDVQTFERSVLVNFVGVSEQLYADQIMVLEDGFQIAYNRFEEDLCDEGSFRTVVDVNIVQQQQTTLQFDFNFDFKKAFATVFQIFFQSNSGGAGANIFANDAPFRKLRKETTGSSTLQQIPCAPCETPPSEIFIMTYNNVLREIAGDTLDNVITVDSVSELEVASCEEEVNLIEASLAIEFSGYPDEASPEELAVLTQSLQDTFNALNGLNDQICDLLFREVVSVEAELDTTQTRRNLQVGTGNSPFVASPFLLYFNVSFQCRGCPSGTTLLTDDAARRHLQLGRHLQMGECLCPVGIVDFRPPSRVEFDAAFNQTMTILIAEKRLRFVTAVGETAEVEEISCPAQVDDRQTQLVIEVEGDTYAVADSAISTLEETLQETLVGLFSEFCDPEVRNVLDVQFDRFGLVQSGRLQSNSMSFLLSFTIVFSCRGCPSDASLFGNDDPRRLLLSNDKARGASARHLQSNGDSCFCDVNVVAARPPTGTEFEVIFQDAVRAADLTTNFAITDVRETEVTPAPISFAPVTPRPMTPQPVTLQPITPSPTSAPVTQAPSAAPSSASILVQAQYEVAFRDGDQGTHADDLVASMDILAAQVVAETLPDQPGRRRLLTASMVFPTNLSSVVFLNSSELLPELDQFVMACWSTNSFNSPLLSMSYYHPAIVYVSGCSTLHHLGHSCR